LHFGVVISILMHAAILGWTFFSIQSQRELRAPQPEPVAIAVIAPSEVTKSRLGAPTAKLLEAEAKETPKADTAKKEAAKPKPAAAAPPPPAPEPPAPKEQQKLDPIAQKLAEAPPPPIAPPPVPAPDEQKKLNELLQDLEREAKEKLKADAPPADAQRKAEEKAEEQRTAEQQKAAEEQKKAADEQKKAAEEKKKAEERRLEEQRRQAELKRKEAEKKRKEVVRKKKLDEDKKRQAEAAKQKPKSWEEQMRELALLDKAPPTGAPPPSAPPPDPANKAKGPALGAPDGRDVQISASERLMLGQIIKSCVQPRWNVLSGGASAQETIVKIRLRFNSDGTLSTPPEVVNPQRTPYFVAISESAVRAVQQCEPFNLPPARYDIWRDMVVNFQPRDMF